MKSEMGMTAAVNPTRYPPGCLTGGWRRPGAGVVWSTWSACTHRRQGAAEDGIAGLIIISLFGE